MGTPKSSPTQLILENERLERRIKELEAELVQARLRERYSRLLLDSLPVKVFLKDAQSRFLLVNEAFSADLGTKPDEVVGKRDSDFYPPELAEKYRADDLSVMGGGKPVTIIERNVMLGHARNVEVTKVPVLAQNKPIGLMGLFTDVTERLRAETALRKSKQFLQAIIDNSPAIVAVKDPKGLYMLVNHRFEELFGYTRSQVYGKTDMELFGPKFAEAIRATDMKVLDSSNSLQVDELLPVGDETRTFSSLKFAVREPQKPPFAVCAITTDISQRKKAEEDLRESEARKAAILESALDAIITVDHLGKITEFNQAAERVFGYRRAQVLGRELSEVIFPSGAREQYRGRVGNYITNRQGSMLGRHVDDMAMRANGQVFPVEMAMTLIMVKSKPVVTLYLRDITERKEAERALQRQSRQLAEQGEQLRRRNEELSKAYDDLQGAETQLIHAEKMAAVGQMVAGLAHEVNTPVAFVLTNLSNMARNTEDVFSYSQVCEEIILTSESLPSGLVEKLQDLRDQFGVDEAIDETKSLLEAARGGLIRIRDLVANLRSFSHIDVLGAFNIDDINSGIRSTLPMVQPIIGKGVNLELQLGELPQIECNMGQINQVVLNLLVNAIQAVGENGQIQVISEADQDGVLVRVRDTGPGIPTEIRSRIFDPFFTTKEVGKGTGLGLSISRRIVELHRGRLEFDSTEGAGTEFRLWLPQHQQAGSGTKLEVDDLENEGPRATSEPTPIPHVLPAGLTAAPLLPIPPYPETVISALATSPSLSSSFLSGPAGGASGSASKATTPPMDMTITDPDLTLAFTDPDDGRTFSSESVFDPPPEGWNPIDDGFSSKD